MHIGSFPEPELLLGADLMKMCCSLFLVVLCILDPVQGFHDESAPERYGSDTGCTTYMLKNIQL